MRRRSPLGGARSKRAYDEDHSSDVDVIQPSGDGWRGIRPDNSSVNQIRENATSSEPYRDRGGGGDQRSAISDGARITRLKKQETEEALRAEVSRLQLLKELHETFRDARELPAIFQRVYDILPQHLGVHRASLLLYDAGRDALVSDQFL